MATFIDRSDGIDLAAELLGHTSTEITRVHYIEPNDEFVNPKTADILERMPAPDAEPLDPTKPVQTKQAPASMPVPLTSKPTPTPILLDRGDR